MGLATELEACFVTAFAAAAAEPTFAAKFGSTRSGYWKRLAGQPRTLLIAFVAPTLALFVARPLPPTVTLAPDLTGVSAGKRALVEEGDAEDRPQPAPAGQFARKSRRQDIEPLVFHREILSGGTNT